MKKPGQQIILLLSLAAYGISGCASSSMIPSPPLTHEAQREPVSSDPDSLNRRLDKLIQEDAQLDSGRKTELLEIVRRLSARNEELLTLMNQKKSLIVKELLSRPYRKDRVESLKRSLLRLNDERARNSLRALEQMKEVMGHQENPRSVADRIFELGGRP